MKPFFSGLSYSPNRTDGSHSLSRLSSVQLNHGFVDVCWKVEKMMMAVNPPAVLLSVLQEGEVSEHEGKPGG